MNFFQLYQKYTEKTEPPVNYHAWSALSVISALLGKKAYMPQGHFTIHPNMYIILVGRPGMRKSTALNVAKNLVRICEKVPIAPESSTREALIDFMSKKKVDAVVEGKEMPYWQAATFAGELEQFLGGKHINSQMIGFLTAIWDEPIFKEFTRKQGEVIIHNPYYSMLAACTPTWMSTKLKQDVISDGFSRRALFILEDKLNCLNPRPVSRPEDIEYLRKLAVEVNRIHLISGEFKLSKEAELLWDTLYEDFIERAKLYSEKLQSYWSSRHVLMAKVAMCLTAGARNDRIIDTQVLMQADLFLAEAERKFEEVFSGIGRNELKPFQDLIVKFVTEHGKAGVLAGDIAGRFQSDLTDQEFRESLDVLVQVGHLKREATSSSFRYFPMKEQTLVQGNNLLELASRIVPVSSQKPAPNSSSSQGHRLDPASEQSLALRKAKEAAERSGVLLRGTLKQQHHKPVDSSPKPAASSVDESDPSFQQ